MYLLSFIIAIDVAAYWSATKWSENRFQAILWLGLSNLCSGAGLLVVGAFYLPQSLPNLYLAVVVVSVMGYIRAETMSAQRQLIE